MNTEALWEALAGGTPLLTATRRLAREVRRRFAVRQSARGLPVWRSPEVLTPADWVRRCWEGTLDADALSLAHAAEGWAEAPVLLSQEQARMVWEEIVTGSAWARPLLSAAGPAEQAQDAWRLLKEWRLPLPAPAAARTPEHKAFAEWAAAYEARCAAEGWLDDVLLPERVEGWLRSGLLEAPPRLLLAGFDTFTPQQDSLLDALRARGSEVEEVPWPDEGERAVRTALPDGEAELWAAARWARHWLEQGAAGPIAIVVPDLTERRERVERVFADVLTPGAILPAAGDAERPWNISQGRTLAAYPLVDCALTLLSLTPGPQPLETIGRLLRTPFLAGGLEEWSARGLLESRLRRRGVPEPSLATVQGLADPGAAGEERRPHAAPLLAEALNRWRRAFERLRQGAARQPPSRWAAGFGDLLRELGWPGPRPLDSAEHQTLAKWHELLEDFARLELVAPRQTRGEALAALRRLAADTDFQPEGGEAPVQILGVLEAAGLVFQRLWLLGVHDEQWPRPPRPNPFLPSDLQRRHDMPRASMARELEIARRQTARLLAAAPDVVVSHPLLEGDRPLRPSPLVAGLPWADPALLPASPTPLLREVLAAGGAMEQLADGTAPPILPGVAATGGVAIFADQAACPFRAFARHRLHARTPTAPSFGLDPLERGTVVHKALEQAWRRLGDQRTLLAQPEAELQALLAEAADAAVSQYAEQHPEGVGPRFLLLERRRVAALMRDWMEQEKLRAPFRVEAREREIAFEIGGVSGQGRIDRIDRLEDGRAVILDYKTGLANVNSWLGDRPDEPQLPLYCVSGEERPGAVAFAQVRREEPRFVGVADPAGLIPRARAPAQLNRPGEAPYASLDALVDDWRLALNGLGAAFRAGAAAVDPKPGDTCKHCDLPALCRIAEVAGREAAEEEESDG